MDGILNDNHQLTVLVIHHLIRDMEILTYKFLPAFLNPFFIETSQTKY